MKISYGNTKFLRPSSEDLVTWSHLCRRFYWKMSLYKCCQEQEVREMLCYLRYRYIRLGYHISGQVTHDNSWGRLNNYVTLKVEISTPHLPVFVMLHFQHFKYVTDVSLTFSNWVFPLLRVYSQNQKFKKKFQKSKQKKTPKLKSSQWKVVFRNKCSPKSSYIVTFLQLS